MTTNKMTQKLKAWEMPIRAVTVYTNRARIERVLSLDLHVGTNEIIIEKFPAAMDGDSLRVDTASLSPDAGITICDVNIALSTERQKASHYACIPELDALSGEQKAEYSELVRRKDQLTTRIAAFEKSASLFHGYADNLIRSCNALAPTPGTAVDVAGTHVHENLSPLEKLDEFVAVYPEKLQALLEKHQDARGELDDIQRAIDDLFEKGKQIHAESNPDGGVLLFGPRLKPTVTVVIESDAAREAKVLVSYLVNGPSWTGSYDIHASLPHAKNEALPSITLIYRASISQRTGESWDNIPLTLSTASPASSFSVPQLQPWRIGGTNIDPTSRPPPPALPNSYPGSSQFQSQMSARHPGGADAADNRFTGFGSTNQSQGPVAGQQDPGPLFGARKKVPTSQATAENAPKPSPFAAPSSSSRSPFGPSPQTMTTKDRGEAVGGPGSIMATINVEAKSSIPSDGSSHKVLITTLTLDADMEWVAVPRQLAAAFLQCRVKNTSDFTLIRGPSQVFFDGNFVAKSAIPDVSPDESFTCSLGIDASVKITYHPQRRLARTDRTAGGPWYAPSSSAKPTDVKAYLSRITVKNLRKTPLARLVLKDQIPVSEDERIKVKMVNPSADDIGPVMPPDQISVGDKPKPGTGASGEVARNPVWANVKSGVRARWAQKSERDGGTGGSRGDGIVEWWCEDVRDELDVELAWQVESPHDIV